MRTISSLIFVSAVSLSVSANLLHILGLENNNNANPALKDIAQLVLPTPKPIYRYPALQPRQVISLPCNDACSNIYSAATLCAADTCLCPTVLSQGVACSSCLVPVDPAIASSFGAIITLCSSELGSATGVVTATATGRTTNGAVTGGGYTISVPVPTTTETQAVGNVPVTVEPTPTATGQSSSSSGGGGGFPKGAIGGIVGGVVGIALLAAAGIFYYKRRERRRADAPVPGTIESIGPEPKTENTWDMGNNAPGGGEEVPSGRLRYPDEDLPALGDNPAIGARTSRHY